MTSLSGTARHVLSLIPLLCQLKKVKNRVKSKQKKKKKHTEATVIRI